MQVYYVLHVHVGVWVGVHVWVGIRVGGGWALMHVHVPS